MIANDFREHCKQVAYWVNWEKTVDQFMAGDPPQHIDLGVDHSSKTIK